MEVKYFDKHLPPLQARPAHTGKVIHFLSSLFRAERPFHGEFPFAASCEFRLPAVAVMKLVTAGRIVIGRGHVFKPIQVFYQIAFSVDAAFF